MKLIIAPGIREKLSKKQPPVTEQEVRQCFANREPNGFLIDTRAKNLTQPLTRWFIAETDHGKRLKVCFIPLPSGEIVIKTAYVADDEEVRIYNNAILSPL